LGKGLRDHAKAESWIFPELTAPAMAQRPTTSKLTGLAMRLLRDRSGNTLAMIGAALVPLLAMVGGGIDMGRSYLSQTRLQQACDAGVLAARKKLGSEVVVSGVVPADTAAVGNRFFDNNFTDGSYGTTGRTFAMAIEDDFSISGVATVTVPTTIMNLFGYTAMPITANCQASLNFSNTDIMFVLDTTGSMNTTNPDDDEPRIDVLKGVVRGFHSQLEGSKGPGIRLRYGFVPFSTNVNVGALLENDWVVDDWTYQSREDYGTTPGEPSTHSYTENWEEISGTANYKLKQTYLATMHTAADESETDYLSCDTPPPASTASTIYTLISTTTEAYAGPPAGTKTIEHYRTVTTGVSYWVQLVGPSCLIHEYTYTDYTAEYDWITIPFTRTYAQYRYAPLAKNVRNWRGQSNGCIEERATYEIDDYTDVDFTRALDLDIDTVPTAGDPDTQWRPMYPNVIYERELDSSGAGSFNTAAVVTTDADFFKPTTMPSMVACPTVSRKMDEMDSTQLNTYLGSISANGTTYPDIGMIWGARLISPTGLFAAENVDVDAKTTSRHIIFLTDGQTEAYDIAYGAYGVEPLDRRRWSPGSPISLNETVEKRFSVACAQAKSRNITVWVIGFGTTLTTAMTDCAGPGHFFEANDAGTLQDVFSKIASQMGDLRISQ
jgi:Flp pilus assembly protein TadG